LLMGILNLTPDSFSDGGRYNSPEKALERALQMLEEGADIIDIGGESTRPGAAEIGAEEEINRIVPLATELRRCRPEAVISVDSRKEKVARAALEAGADIINDISGLQHSPGMAKLAAEKNAGIILMHMRGEPRTMQEPKQTSYGDMLAEVCRFLKAAAKSAEAAGVPRENIVLDPGIGFAKTASQSWELLRRLGDLTGLDYSLLLGASRKSFLKELPGADLPEKRLGGSLGVAAWAFARGVGILRVHDVRETAQLMAALEKCGFGGEESRQ